MSESPKHNVGLCRFQPDKKTVASEWRCRHMNQFKEFNDFNMGVLNIKKFNNYDSFDEDFYTYK